MTDTPKINTVETNAGCLDEALIREAIAVGHRVEKGAMAAMRKFSDGVHELPGTAVPPPSPACCGSKASKSGKNYCG